MSFGSFPYWPQPGYLYRRSVPNAPAPAAMGAFTHGSFESKIPWALPDYVANEATGLEGTPGYYGGYDGFGEFDVPGVGTVTCDPSAVISKILAKLPSMLEPVRGPLQSVLTSLAKPAVAEMLGAASKGTAVFSGWLNKYVAPALTSTLGATATQTLLSLTAGELCKVVNATLQECLQAVGGTLIQDFQAGIGLPQPSVATGFITYTPEQWRAAAELLPPGVEPSQLTPNQLQILKAAAERVKLSPTATATAASASAAAPMATSNKALLLGAAALALLLLVR